MAWGRRQKLASRALAEGDLDTAAEHLKHDRRLQTFSDHRVLRQLTAALVRRADHSTSAGNLSFAWKDLTIASDIAATKDEDLISRQKHQLVELTIETANSLLSSGKTTHALQMIHQLGKREIMDWRADRIRNAAECIQASDDLEAYGKIPEAIGQLELAQNIHPDLPFLTSKIGGKRMRQRQLNQLTSELQASALKRHWVGVQDCCREILVISPKHEIALAAQRHCRERISRKTSAGKRTHHAANTELTSQSFFQVDGPSATHRAGDLPDGTRASAHRRLRNSATGVPGWGSFVLWVDGVGGYLVCTSTINTIGQAIDQSNVSIPILGDLNRRHARIETLDGQHVLQPLGDVRVDGGVTESAVEIKDQQTIELAGGIKLKYSQSHPLSKTARLDLVSRHRTQPWSDGVLLVSQSIILGPNRNNHVHCPTWRFDLILFHRHGKWFCRAKESFEIDGRSVEKEGEINLNSRIVGEDYSLTLEPI